jgi:Beta-ketoacyl synthase, N-terminal domain
VTAGVLGRSVLHCADPAAYASNAPSMFADPVAWLVCAVAEEATGQCADVLARSRDDVGVLVVSEFATLTTMRSIAGSARRGRVSPLRFAGANPAVVAGLVCIRQGFRGPALTLSMPVATGVLAAAAVADGLLSSGAAGHLVLATHTAAAGHTAACAVVDRRVRPQGWPDVRAHLSAPGAR